MKSFKQAELDPDPETPEEKDAPEVAATTLSEARDTSVPEAPSP